MQTEATQRPAHEGRNVKRIHEILGIKQEALALDLGLSQQAISALEQKEALDKEMLEKVAMALKVSPEAIKSFNEEAAVNIVANTFNSNDNSTLNAVSYQCTFNPLEKLMEALDENKKLYERLLQLEKDKVTMLERMIEKKS